VTAALWWAYFDVVAVVAERRLRAADPDARVRMARDSFTYLHLPMVAGIVLLAVGLKKTLAHVGVELDAVPAFCLCGGVALYLLALSAFKRRNIGSWNVPRLIAAAALLLAIPAATATPRPGSESATPPDDAQASARRSPEGVSPVSLRRTRHRWLWSANPRSAASRPRSA
jgi:low temperature requirement protein LtrA